MRWHSKVIIDDITDSKSVSSTMNGGCVRLPGQSNVNNSNARE